MLLKLLIVLTLLLSVSLAAKGADAKDDDAIQGTWLPSTAELAGMPFPEEVRKTIKLNPKAKPKELDINGTDGPNKGKTILAIYELDGDTLRVCYDLGGKNRPTEFKTKEGSQLFLVTYKREKP